MKNTSPDGQHYIILKPEGEIPHSGIIYGSLVSIDGHEPEEHTFLGISEWSADSRYLAIQQWLSTSVAPKTRARVYDLETLEYADGPVLEKQFAQNFKFDGDQLQYKSAGYQVETQSLTMDLKQQNWKPFVPEIDSSTLGMDGGPL